MSCPRDCNQTSCGVCGDLVCDGNETCSNCIKDCAQKCGMQREREEGRKGGRKEGREEGREGENNGKRGVTKLTS